jgi:hypothetical protein
MSVTKPTRSHRISFGMTKAIANPTTIPPEFSVRIFRDGSRLNPDAPAVKREAEEDWGRDRWR